MYTAVFVWRHSKGTESGSEKYELTMMVSDPIKQDDASYLHMDILQIAKFEQWAKCCHVLYVNHRTEQFSVEWRKTRTKPITHQFDYSASLNA